MRKFIVAGNWKMNTCLNQGVKLAESINEHLSKHHNDKIKIILGVPFTHLDRLANRVVDFTKISIAAQNCAKDESGAFTGEVSSLMVKSTGASHIIIGHSERRQLFGETNSIIKSKLEMCLKHSMFPIFCCGETLEQRNANKHFEVVGQQIEEGLFGFDEFNFKRIIIAYEPVWAIGTGVNASPDQAQEMHSFIREKIAEKFNKSTADKIHILYGGSVKPDNCKVLFNQPDIDGGLIGGASLNKEDFISIINQTNELLS